eukprot:COSAG01_NODE_3184_length_6446_cov_3.562155_1_plen_232_part_00
MRYSNTSRPGSSSIVLAHHVLVPGMYRAATRCYLHAAAARWLQCMWLRKSEQRAADPLPTECTCHSTDISSQPDKLGHVAYQQRAHFGGCRQALQASATFPNSGVAYCARLRPGAAADRRRAAPDEDSRSKKDEVIISDRSSTQYGTGGTRVDVDGPLSIAVASAHAAACAASPRGGSRIASCAAACCAAACCWGGGGAGWGGAWGGGRGGVGGGGGGGGLWVIAASRGSD